MNKAIDLTGRRFGYLTAIEVAQRKPIKWKCICDCGEVRFVEVSALLRKKRPRVSCGCHIKSEIIVDIGKVFETKSCGNIEIIGKIDNRKYLCKFEDGVIIEALDGNIRRGMVANPCKITAFGIGYNGIGPYQAHGEKSHAYWYKMMQRAYCPEYKSAHPTYDDVTVCEEWHCFQNFAEWVCARKQYGMYGFNLDKDLIKPGNKVYCPEYCSLVPQEINKLTVRKSRVRSIPQGVVDYGTYFVAKCRTEDDNLYLGTFNCPEIAGEVYRKFKKEVIVKTANKFKDQIDDLVYEALLNFEVEW